MKKTFFLMLGCALAFAVQAKSLVVVLADGTQVYYLLGGEKDPVMVYDKEHIIVNADQYTFSGVDRFYVSKTDDPSSVDGVKIEGMKFDGNTLYVSAENKRIAVYMTNGVRVAVGQTVKNGLTAVPMASLPSGTYIVRVGETSFKFCKK